MTPGVDHRGPKTVGVTTIGGYLGAGKTTLINRLLSDATEQRIAVLVNDFGGINIDVALIKDRSATTIALTNGCACCVLGDELASAFASVAAAFPPFDHIVVEASGVADPRRMAEWAHLPGLHSVEVVVVADATTVRERSGDRYVGSKVRRQLAVADRILLSYLDVASASGLSAVEEWLNEVAPEVAVTDSRGYEMGRPLAATVDPKKPGTEDHPPFLQCTIELQHPIERDRLLAYFAQEQRGLARVKGFVDVIGSDGKSERYLLQVVGREVVLIPRSSSTDEEPAIVFIGLSPDFDPALFARNFRAGFCND